jgi:Uncharacterized protein conserved in bacteria (DUF2334)
MTVDELRTMRLLLDAELSEGLVTDAELQAFAARAAAARGPLAVRRVPPLPARLLAQVRYKLGGSRLAPLGGLNYERAVAVPQMRARSELLGEHVSGPSRFLIRVDEFPHFRVCEERDRLGTASFAHFHAILASAGVPYLLAVLPRISRDPLLPGSTDSRPLDDSELTMLAGIRRDRVAFALHGRDHHTRFSQPRRRSELCGLSSAATAELIEGGLSELDAHGLQPRVFVPPFNRFDADQLPVLAAHFMVVCGGPESIGQLGFQPTPQARAGTVYLPAYSPFYGRAAEMLGPLQRMLERPAGLWVPVVLHWEWERRAGWSGLERLAAAIASSAAPWEDFLAAVRRSVPAATPGRPG